MFNLLTEPWIPVLTTRSRPEKIGILEALERAHELRCIDLEPLSETAVLRLLVAFVTRAYDTPDIDAWGEMMEAGRFDMAAIRDYAERVHDRFELLDSPAPFMQSIGDTEAVIEPWEATKLLPWRRTNANTTFSVEAPGPLTFDEAAIGLLVHHAFDTGGIKQRDYIPGKSKTTKGYGPTATLNILSQIVHPYSTNLRTTILLNIVPADMPGSLHRDGDLPNWEREPLHHRDERSEVTGPIDAAAWMSRRPQLIHDGSVVTGFRNLVPGKESNVEAERYATFDHYCPWNLASTKYKGLRVPARNGERRIVAWHGVSDLLYTADPEPGKQPTSLPPVVVDSVRHLLDEGLLDERTPLTFRHMAIKTDAMIATHQDVLTQEVTVPGRALHDPKMMEQVRGVLSTTAASITDVQDLVYKALGAARNVPPAKQRSDAALSGVARDVMIRIYAGVDSPLRRWIAHPDDDAALTQVKKALSEAISSEIDFIMQTAGPTALTHMSGEPETAPSRAQWALKRAHERTLIS